jgi:hypothetical protein
VVASTPRELGGLRYGLQGTIFAATVGLGEAAAPMLKSLMTQHQPGAVLSLGFAGALVPHVPTGMLVVCDRFVTRDPAHPPAITAAADAVRKVARTIGGCVGGLLTAPAPLLMPATKEAAGAESGAMVVDMEGYWMAQAAADSGVPLTAIRVVLDAMTHQLPQLVADIIADGGKREWHHTAMALALNPFLLARLAPLAHRSWRAQRAMHQAVRALAPMLAAGPQEHA